MNSNIQSFKGFLLTCDQNKQKQAIKDAYNFITQYIEKQYENIQQQTIRKIIKTQGQKQSLQAQLKLTKKVDNRLLSSVDTNVKCLIFIKINNNYTQIDPNLVVQTMMKDMHQSERQLTRYCHKILPVQKAFLKAQHFTMIDTIRQLLQKRDNSEKKSWALNFKCRNNSKFNYKQVLKQTQNIFKQYGHFVDIYFPQWTVSIQIVNHLMCIGISQKFKEYQEFKLRRKPFEFTQQQRQRYEAFKNKNKSVFDYQIKNKKGDKEQEQNNDKKIQDLQNKQDFEGIHHNKKQNQNIKEKQQSNKNIQYKQNLLKEEIIIKKDQQDEVQFI